jgi:hypothetical protein
MIKVIQANCRASDDIMTVLMSAAVRAGAEVVLIQEPSVRTEEDKWKVKIRYGNYVYIYSGDNDRPYVLTAVRKDVVWNDYGGSRNAERVGIDIGNTRIINIYHHRDKRMDRMNIMQELDGNRHRKWVCAGDFNRYDSLLDAKGTEPAGSWREVKDLIESGRLMIVPGTLTWKGKKNHRPSTIDLVIASNAAQVSIVEIASDLYTGSDHETVCCEIDQGGNTEGTTPQDLTPRWTIREPIKDDEKDEEDEWQQEWMNRLYLGREPRLLMPLEQILLFKSFLDDIIGQQIGHREINGGGQKNPSKKETFWPKLEEHHHRLAINLSR